MAKEVSGVAMRRAEPYGQKNRRSSAVFPDLSAFPPLPSKAIFPSCTEHGECSESFQYLF